MIGDGTHLNIPDLHLHVMQGHDPAAVAIFLKGGSTLGMPEYYFMFIVRLCCIKSLV